MMMPTPTQSIMITQRINLRNPTIDKPRTSANPTDDTEINEATGNYKLQHTSRNGIIIDYLVNKHQLIYQLQPVPKFVQESAHFL